MLFEVASTEDRILTPEMIRSIGLDPKGDLHFLSDLVDLYGINVLIPEPKCCPFYPSWVQSAFWSLTWLRSLPRKELKDETGIEFWTSRLIAKCLFKVCATRIDSLRRKHMLQICLYQKSYNDVFIRNRTLVRFGGILGEFGWAMVCIFASRGRAEISMARPKSLMWRWSVQTNRRLGIIIRPSGVQFSE